MGSSDREWSCDVRASGVSVATAIHDSCSCEPTTVPLLCVSNGGRASPWKILFACGLQFRMFPGRSPVFRSIRVFVFNFLYVSVSRGRAADLVQESQASVLTRRAAKLRIFILSIYER